MALPTSCFRALFLLEGVIRAKMPQRVPAKVLTQETAPVTPSCRLRREYLRTAAATVPSSSGRMRNSGRAPTTKRKISSTSRASIGILVTARYLTQRPFSIVLNIPGATSLSSIYRKKKMRCPNAHLFSRAARSVFRQERLVFRAASTSSWRIRTELLQSVPLRLLRRHPLLPHLSPQSSLARQIGEKTPELRVRRLFQMRRASRPKSLK